MAASISDFEAASTDRPSLSCFSAWYAAFSAAVAGLDQLALAAVLVGVRLGVLDHPLDLCVSEAGAGLDLDLLLLAGAEVLAPTR